MATSENKTKAAESENDEYLPNYQWMIRPCETYREEYSECTSIKARFNQYFINGDTTNCSPWKVDYDNCRRWREDKNVGAFKELIASEEQRRKDRLEPHYKNNVWKKRVGPPPEWDKPLPAWLEEENKATFLALKAEEIKNLGKPIEGERTLCAIM